MPRPAAPLTCQHEILSDSGEWLPCGAPVDGLHPDARPCCPRCREIAGMAFAALIDEIVAASAEFAAQQPPKAA